uniref:DUF1624 domain-containing protein n=1 Tax=Heterorhabditis bacteriophora TaxID=37862 RepID=A0A1I7WRB6_HETBA
MFFYMKNVILLQQGESVAAGKKLLKVYLGKIRRFHFVNVMLFMMIAVHYFGDDIVHFEHRVFYFTYSGVYVYFCYRNKAKRGCALFTLFALCMYSFVGT